MTKNDDSYGQTIRQAMKHSMSEPANIYERRRPRYDNLRVFLWCFAGILAGATAILVYDRLIQHLR